MNPKHVRALLKKNVEKAKKELAEAYKGGDWEWINICQTELLIAQERERGELDGCEGI